MAAQAKADNARVKATDNRMPQIPLEFGAMGVEGEGTVDSPV